MTDEMIIKNAYEVIEACANLSKNTLSFCNSVSGILSAMDRGALQAASMTGQGLPGYGGNKGALNPIRYSGVSQCARSVTKLNNLATALTPIVSTGFSNLTGYDQDIVDQILGKKSSGHDYIGNAFFAGGLVAESVSVAGDIMEYQNISSGKMIGKYGTITGGILDASGEFKSGDYSGAAIAGLGTIAKVGAATLVEDINLGVFVDAPVRILGAWNDDIKDPNMSTERKLKEMAGEATVASIVTVAAIVGGAILFPETAGALMVAGVAVSVFYGVGNLVDKIWGTGEGDVLEALSDGLISVGEKFEAAMDNAAKEVGNAIQSGWNTFCSWFS